MSYVLCDVMTYYLMLWRTCWRHNLLLDAMTYFGRHDVLLKSWLTFDIITYFLTSWSTFEVLMYFLTRVFTCVLTSSHTFHNFNIVTCFLMSWRDVHVRIVTSPPEGVARYCFHPVCLSVCLCVCVSVCLYVCLSVCLCVRPILWYFISRL